MKFRQKPDSRLKIPEKAGTTLARTMLISNESNLFPESQEEVTDSAK
jgi:hypothetical protein